jgi:CubicO group peptidase (beta-lactamase class C family)
MVVFATPCATSDTPPSTPESRTPTTGATPDLPWPRSTPEEQGISSQNLIRALGKIRDDNLDVHSVIIIRNGHVILEAYVHPYGPDDLHNVKSVSKSVISAVVGIALEEGILESLDQPVYDFFPQYFTDDGDPRKKKITLRHLITMTAGFDLDENGPKMRRVFQSDDWIKTTLETELAHDPGTRFLYSTPLTHTMSGILTEASGKSLLELTTEHVFEPIGIAEVRWSQGPKGYYLGGAELFLTPRDMARFGMLFLRGGRWGDGQVVPAAWVEESTANRIADVETSQRYGYWWWPADDGYNASGWGGQGIGVHPALDLVAIGTAADPGASNKMFGGLDPPSPDVTKLPPDPEAVAKLEQLVHDLAHPKPRPVAELPKTARKISGKTWVFDENPFGLQEFSPVCKRGLNTCTFSWTSVQGTYSTEIGLDGLYRLTDMGTVGQMPDGNRVAVRGGWTGDRTFEMESTWMGNPVVSAWRFVFDDEHVAITAEIRPTGRTQELTARKK